VYWDHGMAWWGYVWLGTWTVLFAVLLVAGSVVLIALTPHDRHAPAGPRRAPTPEQVLASRFAHGDIDEAEYRNRLTVLRDHAHS
jgi:putative membrane protein